MPSFKPVAALSRGLAILRAVNEQGEATVGTIHKTTGLDKATVVRMLETLQHEGLIIRNESRAAYSVTGRALLLSNGYNQHTWVAHVAEPIIGEFQKEVGWPSDIGLFDQTEMIVAATTREPGSLLMSRRPGFRFPILATSMGRAYFAYCDEERRDEIIRNILQRGGPFADIAADSEQVRRIVAETLERGYAEIDERYSREIFNRRLYAIGVPIKSQRQVFGSINITVLREAISPEDTVARFLGPLQATAANIAAELSSAGAP